MFRELNTENTIKQDKYTVDAIARSLRGYGISDENAMAIAARKVNELKRRKKAYSGSHGNDPVSSSNLLKVEDSGYNAAIDL